MSRNYLEAFIVVLVTTAFWYFLVLPQNGELADVKQKIEEKNAEMKNRQDYYDNLEKAVAELDQYAGTLKKVETAFPDNQDAAPLLSFLQSAAMQSGLILKSANYSGKTMVGVANLAGIGVQEPAGSKETTLQTYDVLIELTGSYPNFKDFLSRVEHSSRLIDLNLVSVSSTKDKSEDAQGSQTQKTPKESPSSVSLNYTIKATAGYYK
jgi:Tfp pilus assembly protein PilO